MPLSAPTMIKGVSVRFIANPELQQGVPETEEMCQKTIGVLEMLDRKRPIIVLKADSHNKDPHAVLMCAYGKPVAYADKDVAPMLRGMLASNPEGIILTRIAQVHVYRHGYIYVEMPKMGDMLHTEDIGVDWDQWACESPLLLPDNFFLEEACLSAVIKRSLLPDLEHTDPECLREYLSPWMDSIRFHHGREVAQTLLHFIDALLVDERPEVKEMSAQLDHLRTKRGTPEVLGEMAREWWPARLEEARQSQTYQHLLKKAAGGEEYLAEVLDYVERIMATMPRELYLEVDDAYQFFCHLYYLAPPQRALQGVLSLLAIRTLLCQTLGIGLEPCRKSGMPREVTDVGQLPTTIGRVMYYYEHLCPSPEEAHTILHLADWLERDSRGHRVKEIEDMLHVHPGETKKIEIHNEFAEGSCRFEAGSSQNGDVNLDNPTPHP